MKGLLTVENNHCPFLWLPQVNRQNQVHRYFTILPNCLNKGVKKKGAAEWVVVCLLSLPLKKQNKTQKQKSKTSRKRLNRNIHMQSESLRSGQEIL